MSLAGLLGLIYLISELLLTITRRSRGAGVKQDRSTLRVLWVVILFSIAAGVLIAARWPAALPGRAMWQFLGLILFIFGLTLRWWAIVVLGRFFTVDVQIAPDHQLVDAGPFHWLRHPSYTGILLAFLGFSLALGNWVALFVIMVPITAAFVRRMNVEEQALQGALGQSYIAYRARTKRLVPGLY